MNNYIYILLFSFRTTVNFIDNLTLSKFSQSTSYVNFFLYAKLIMRKWHLNPETDFEDIDILEIFYWKRLSNSAYLYHMKRIQRYIQHEVKSLYICTYLLNNLLFMKVKCSRIPLCHNGLQFPNGWITLNPKHFSKIGYYIHSSCYFDNSS